MSKIYIVNRHFVFSNGCIAALPAAICATLDLARGRAELMNQEITQVLQASVQNGPRVGQILKMLGIKGIAHDPDCEADVHMSNLAVPEPGRIIIPGNGIPH